MNNPGYIRYEQRERHAIIDQALNDSLETLHTPEVALRLGGRTLTLMRLISQTTIPNIHHGVITPTHTDAELIEIIALHTNEQVYRRYQDVSFNDLQMQNLHTALPDFAQQFIDAHHTRHNSADIFAVNTFTSLHKAAAHTLTATLPLRSAQGLIYTQGRPLVVLNADRAADRHPVFVLHELTHVQQINDSPVMNPHAKQSTIHAERELEAYYVSAQIIRGQNESSSPQPRLDANTAHQLLDIDVIRERHQHKNRHPFGITKALLRDLHRNDHEIITIANDSRPVVD